MPEYTIAKDIVTTAESEIFEMKSCRDSLSKDFWPTYSAFANTFGGTALLGIEDGTHRIIGVNNPEKIIKELWDLLNDSKKVSANILSSSDVLVKEHEGKTLIEIHVPRAERHKRPVYINDTMEHGTYKRNGEGDYHCSIDELSQMLRDSAETSQDLELIDTLDLDALDDASIRGFRERMVKRNPSHPWNDKNDTDFLKMITAVSRDKEGAWHPTLGGLLMFGYDYSIMSIIPNYHLEYLEYPVGSDKWTYRLETGTGEFTGNIYNFLMISSNRLSLMNPRRKELDGTERIDETKLMRAQRELLVNALTHADYRGMGGIRAEWYPDSFSVRNPGNLRIPLEYMMKGGISDPRNPHIAVMMDMMGMAERAGSGVSETVSSCDEMGIPRPCYKETAYPATVNVTIKWGISDNFNSIRIKIKEMVRDNPKISMDTIAANLGLDRNKIIRTMNAMKEKGELERIGGTRGRWSVKSPGTD